MSARVAGADCHKDSHVIAVLDDVGRVLEELAITWAPEFSRALDVTARWGELTWGSSARDPTGGRSHSISRRRATACSRFRRA